MTKLLSILSLAVPLSLQADVWTEREALAKVQLELAALEALVMTAKTNWNPEDRTSFNYQLLINDLRKIQGGIATHLAVPMEPVVPSTIDPLATDYTEHQQ